MSELYIWLFRRAAEAARAAQERGVVLKKQILDAEQHKTDAEAAIESAKSAHQYLTANSPTRETNSNILSHTVSIYGVSKRY